jgi:uncharacterized protein (TIGR02646 family)
MIAIKPYFDEVISSLSMDYLSKKRNKTKENPKGDSWMTLLLRQQQQHKFDSSIYGAKDVKDRLIEIFHNKCAFCECDTSAGAAYDVEHFRPKILYYWLCYEWSNLLLCCQVCNRSYKQAHFPLEKEVDRVKNHVAQHGLLDKTACHILAAPLKAENPLLLHPALDEPNEHLVFLKNGCIAGLTEKGRVSIEKYGLNRDDLIFSRKNILLEIQKDILRVCKKAQTAVEQTQMIQWEIERRLSKLVSQVSDNQPFTGFKRTLLGEFDTFIIDNEDLGYSLPNRDIMKAAVKAFFED